MTLEQLTQQIKQKKSVLCVGLDTDLKKTPSYLLDKEYPIFEFNKAIIDATAPYTIAYKPNIAFYEAYGKSGWENLELSVNYIRDKYPGIFLIADAKRGDIGNTSGLYARAFFEQLDFDAVTVAPYMGEDSVKPFLEFDDKWIIVLGLTSNKGASDFQFSKNENGKYLYQQVIEKAATWGKPENTMFVVGATQADMLSDIRKIIPNHFLLVPGVGAQGGSLTDVIKYGKNQHAGLIINSSRGIIYADSSVNFAKVARQKARELQSEMAKLL